MNETHLDLWQQSKSHTINRKWVDKIKNGTGKTTAVTSNYRVNVIICYNLCTFVVVQPPKLLYNGLIAALWLNHVWNVSTEHSKRFFLFYLFGVFGASTHQIFSKIQTKYNLIKNQNYSDWITYAGGAMQEFSIGNYLCLNSTVALDVTINTRLTKQIWNSPQRITHHAHNIQNHFHHFHC